VAFPVSAGAATTADCETQIEALRTDTAAVTTFVNAKDQTELLNKLDGAATALTAGKSAGAVLKLTDFQAKVQALGSTGKLGAEDAARLDAGAAAAVSCLESVGT
jgi:hypothetical protein